MNSICLFDDEKRGAFLPFTYSRPVAGIRFGALTIREKWLKWTGLFPNVLTLPYLRGKHPLEQEEVELLVNARLLPNEETVERIRSLRNGELLTQDGVPLAFRPKEERMNKEELLERYDQKGVEGLLKDQVSDEHAFEAKLIERKWELFSRNGDALASDLPFLRKEKTAASPDPSNTLIGDDPPFIEEGAEVLNATLNTNSGPIHIAEGAEVMEGASIRGPFYLGPHGVVKMGARIYGPTSIGPYGKVGGELNNSVIFGYSNKAHDGFLGNSVIGEWCNLGADTNNSNLKNNYGPVRVWDHEEGEFLDSGLTFCGIFMGDHSKCGINTMFNTGTSIGFSANVFGGGFPPKAIPSYFWGGAEDAETFQVDKAREVARKMRERRDLDFDEEEERIFDTIYRWTEKERERFGI